MTEFSLKVYTKGTIDERKVKSAAVVGIDCIYIFKGFEEVINGNLLAN